jgi:hypothetical protein
MSVSSPVPIMDHFSSGAVASPTLVTSPSDLSSLSGIPELAILAFRRDISTMCDAETALKGKCPGTFFMYRDGTKMHFAIVQPGGHVEHKPFRWDEKTGTWRNGGAECYGTTAELFEHLLDGQFPIPYYATEDADFRKGTLMEESPFTCFAYASPAEKNTLCYVNADGEVKTNTFRFYTDLLAWKNGGAGTSSDALGLFHHMMQCKPGDVKVLPCLA